MDSIRNTIPRRAGRRPSISFRARHLGLPSVLWVLSGLIAPNAHSAASHVLPDGRLDLVAIQATIDRLGLRFAVSPNEFTAMTAEERARHAGALEPALAPGWEPAPLSGRDLPAQFDWREHQGGSYVTPVRHQGPCGACWAFAPVAMLESWLLIDGGTPGLEIDLSEQHVVSCTPSYNNCLGGDAGVAMDHLVATGAPLESCLPYAARDDVPCSATCTEAPQQAQRLLRAWRWVTDGHLVVDVAAIKDALLDGPVITWMRVHESLYGYDEGVYSADGSPATLEAHFVLIVGWDDGEQCWFAKNSWGRHWGEDGFFRIAYQSGCGFGRWTAQVGGVAVYPTSLNFRVPEIGASQQQSFTVLNGTDDWLTGQFTFAHAEFAVAPAGCDVGPGEQQTVMVTYTPRDYGSDSAVIDVPAPARRVLCTGIGPAYSPTTLLAWGDNEYGQCNVVTQEHYLAVAAGLRHSLALLAGGRIVGWGSNAYGQCDPPPPNDDFVAVAAGGYHSLGLRSDGSIAAWGWNAYGQCDAPAPDQGFVAIAAGVHHSLALRADGSVAAWGWNSDGQCDVPEPNTGFVGCAGGQKHSLGLRADGSITAWGRNLIGVPAPNSGYAAVAAGFFHNLAVRADGTLVAWGTGGDGSMVVPEPNVDFLAVAAGYDNSIAVRRDGSLAVWGLQASTPSGAGRHFIAVAAGYLHYLAISSNESVGIGETPGSPEEPIADVPAALAIAAVSPNPFNPSTAIRLELPRPAAAAVVAIHDLRGRLVRTLWQGPLGAGHHTLRWDGCDDRQRAMPSGIYLVRLATESGERRAVKITLAR
jgi:hypothetical protein